MSKNEVPPLSGYGLIGSGRLAQNLAHYFSLLGVKFGYWNRRSQSDRDRFDLSGEFYSNLDDLCRSHSTILLAVSDSAIDELALKVLSINKNVQVIHFSGGLISENALSVHPLMTFTKELKPLSFYERVPFICEEDGPRFSEIFPALKNPSFYIPKEKKPFYHSLCVMSGNFSVLLWNKLAVDFQKELGLDAEVALPYFEAISENIRYGFFSKGLTPANEKEASRNLASQKNLELSLTGPLARKDEKTIAANLKSLQEDDFLPVFEAFTQTYQQIMENPQ